MSEELFLYLALYYITLEMKHVEDKLNLLADYLSRWHVDSRYSQQFMDLTKARLLHEQVPEEDIFRFTLIEAKENWFA